MHFGTNRLELAGERLRYKSYKENVDQEDQKDEGAALKGRKVGLRRV